MNGLPLCVSLEILYEYKTAISVTLLRREHFSLDTFICRPEIMLTIKRRI